jgi:hypothetical protein
MPIASLGPIAGPASWSIDQIPASFDPHIGTIVWRQDEAVMSFPPLLAVAQPRVAGDAIQTFGADFYDRIHYSFLTLDLGNLIGEQVRYLYVWNAYRTGQRLGTITPDNTEGISFSSSIGDPPIIYPATYQATYTITIALDGPANVDARWLFDWVTTADATVRITGSRITGWAWLPDWSNGVIERLEWKTDVLGSYDGREQRRALRLAPRKTFEFEFFVSGRERRYAEAAIWGWGSRSWALPIWPDGQRLTSAAVIGTYTVAIETTSRDFQADAFAMLHRDSRNFEVVEIESVSPGALTLKRPLGVTWPAGLTTIYPARTARLADRVTLPRWTGTDAGARVSFDITDPIDYTASGGATTYRGLPVITRQPNWSEPFEEELQRKLAEIDNLTGRRVFEDESGLPALLQRMRWTLTSRAEQDAVRQLLYAMRGRHAAAWVPSFASDVTIVAAIFLADTAIDIEHQDYAKFIAQQTGRRDIRIETTTGAVYYRRILSSSEINSTTERLTIDTALGVTLQLSDIALVSFMALMRNESDAAEIAYWTGDVADIAIAVRSFEHDL